MASANQSFFRFMFTTGSAIVEEAETLTYEVDRGTPPKKAAAPQTSDDRSMRKMLIITANIIIGAICVLSFIAIVVFAIMQIAIPAALPATLAATIAYYGGAIASYFKAQPASGTNTANQ